jgi:hypothetical protein
MAVSARQTGISQDADQRQVGMTLGELTDFVRNAWELGVPPDTPITVKASIRGRIKALLAK